MHSDYNILSTPEFAINVVTNPENYTISEIVGVLEYTSDIYHNGDEAESPIDDAQWDGLYRYLQIADPVNKYLIGVGAEVRGDKVLLAYPMPGLDQVHEGDIEKWISANNLSDVLFVALDKLDGNSGQIVYDTDGNLQSAFSRGSSTEGQDQTRHYKRMKNCPQQVSEALNAFDGSTVIRVEVEMKESVFEKLNAQGLLLKRNGEPYSNPRNYIAGQLNSTEADQLFYDNVDIISYEIMMPELIDKETEIAMLRDSEFDFAEYHTYHGKNLSDAVLAKRLDERHKGSPWAIDGLVLVPSVRKIREAFPARKGSSLNPVHSKKFKVGQEDNIAEAVVIKVEWKVSKDGYLKPRVWIEPVELVGVTVSKATGFNAKYIYDNKIGPGSIVKITRAGDVIPLLLSSSPMPEQNMD